MSALRLRYGQSVESVETQADGASLIVRRDGREVAAEILARDADSLVLRVGEGIHRARVFRAGRELYVHLDGRTLHLHWLDEEEDDEVDAHLVDPVVRAPMPGRIIELLANVGESVEAGAPVVRVEAMKMEVDLTASVSGVVETVHVQPGDLVSPDAVLVTLRPDEDAAAP